MGVLAGTFADCAARNRAALVLYVTAGHPRRDEGLRVLETLAEAGADIIELGVPFSDPLADGPTIQRSSFDAIQQGVDLPWTLELLRGFRERHDTPVVLFTYLNPVLRYGVESFIEDAAHAGANGVLLTDLPAGADPGLEQLFAASPLDLIRLIAPTTLPDRVGEIASTARGFLYYISRTGVTGARAELASGLEREVAGVRALSSVPVAVGFGISTPAQVGAVAAVAEGVVVGSALVELLGRAELEEVGRYVRSLAEAAGRR